MADLDSQIDRLLAVIDETLAPGQQGPFTRRIIAELRDTRSSGQPVAQHDVNQLKFYFGEDLAAANKEALG